jgi:hypothetical protein
MLNINVKSEEPLKILETSSGSSPGVDMSIHVIKLPYISRETVSLSLLGCPSKWTLKKKTSEKYASRKSA